MNDLVVKNVDLFGNDVVAVKDKNGDIWAGISNICNGIGLSKSQKDSQVEKVQKDSLLQQGCRKFPAGVLDQGNEVVALKLDFIPLWLAKISITPSMKGNNPELADKLIKYQLRAKDILAEAFLLPQPAITYQYPVPAASLESATNAGRLFERIMRSEGVPPPEIAMVVRSIFLQAGIDIPSYVIKIPAYEQLTLDIAVR